MGVGIGKKVQTLVITKLGVFLLFFISPLLPGFISPLLFAPLAFLAPEFS